MVVVFSNNWQCCLNFNGQFILSYAYAIFSIGVSLGSWAMLGQFFGVYFSNGNYWMATMDYACAINYYNLLAFGLKIFDI